MVLITERWANGCERVSTTNQQHFNGSNETPEGIALSFGNHAVNLDLNPSEIITRPDGASRSVLCRRIQRFAHSRIC